MAYGNWSSRASTSKDATHAKKVLGAMLRKVSKVALPALQRNAPPLSPILAGQSFTRPPRHRPNHEMPWIRHDYVSAPATAFAPRVPAVLPEFLRQESETLGFKNQGLLSTMRYLDFSDVAPEAPDFNGQDDLGSLIDSTNEIDWVSTYRHQVELERDSSLAVHLLVLISCTQPEHGRFLSAGP